MSSEQFRKAGDEIDKAIRQSDKRLTNTAIGKELEIDEATIRKVRNGEKAKR